MTDNDLDELLGTINFVKAQDNFTETVMQAISELPEQNTIKKTEWWQWAALIGGGFPAVLQVQAFIFSTWNVANVG